MKGRSGLQHRGGAGSAAMTVLFLAVLLTVSAGNAAVITKSYSFASDQVVIRDTALADTVFDIITMSNCIPDDRLLGAPQLPQRAVSFVVPYDQKLDSVIATANTVETLPGTYYPMPIQVPHDTVSPFYPPLWYLYQWGYPGSFVDGTIDGTMATYNLASFYLRPVRLLPGGRLVKVESLTVDIYTSSSLVFGGIAQRRRSEFCEEELKRTVGALVENPDDVDLYGVPVPIGVPQSPLVISERPSLNGSTVDCVIITQREDSAEYDRYARFLTERGVVTTVRTLGWCAESYNQDGAASMRALLKEADSLWGTQYAILAGWPTNQHIGLPTRLIRGDGEGGVDPWQGWATTDVYFADLEGTWDDNDNGVYADPPFSGVNAFFFTDELHGCGVNVKDLSYQSCPFVTQDGGASWSWSFVHQSEPWVSAFYDMFFIDGEHGWCVGQRSHDGVIEAAAWRTTNGGSDWTECEVADEYAQSLWSVCFTSANCGWAVGCRYDGQNYTGVILRTTDGGANWMPDPQSPLPSNLTDVEFSTSGLLGWIATESDYEWRNIVGLG